MQNVLITLGDSFTYGEGLTYEYIKNNHPESFQEILKLPQNVLSKNINLLTEMMKDLEKYRTENNYSYFLKEKLNIPLISNCENGGRNIERLMNLDFLIENSILMKIYTPKYVVFQLTHIGRDIEDMLITNNRTEKYILETFGIDFITKVKNASVNEKTAWDLDLFFEEAVEIFITKLQDRFNLLKERYGTKCLFFFGLGDLKSIEKKHKNYLTNPYFMEIIDKNIVYYTWLDMCTKLKLNLRYKLGVPDDHPTSESHKLISDKLYQKLTANGL
jgi:hypothetical protein